MTIFAPVGPSEVLNSMSSFANRFEEMFAIVATRGTGGTAVAEHSH